MLLSNAPIGRCKFPVRIQIYLYVHPSLTCTIQHGTPLAHTTKKCLYFDPDGIGARTIDIPMLRSLLGVAEHVNLESLESFFQGRQRIRGCKVGVTRNNRRHFYMVYTKHRKTQVNSAIMEESRNREYWDGPLVVMRLDAVTATRLVSITSKSHREIAILAVAKYVFLLTTEIAPTYVGNKKGSVAL